MIFYYAAGGGLGHLTRARAVIHTLGLQDRVALLTASPFATDRRVVGALEVIAIPQNFSTDRQAYRLWLQETLRRYRPAEIFLDAFPAGLLGEFSNYEFANKTGLFHVARGLRWAVYQRQLDGAIPQFETTYVLEPLEAEQQKVLAQQSLQLTALALTDPPHELSEAMKQAAIALLRPTVSELLPTPRQASAARSGSTRPLWLIVHTGSPAEINELIAYAVEMSRQERLEPRLVLLTPTPPNDTPDDTPATQPPTAQPEIFAPYKGLSVAYSKPEATAQIRVEHFDFYPASAIFPVADRIITACGFNAMRQTEAYRDKHRFLPFERQFDNQFARAYRRKNIVPLN
ncbi:MAG: hypothetical protein HY231_15190 [Acidobacteria bacterium]|nr:hypothetical protein [Acidobacteriota bacterium]